MEQNKVPDSVPQIKKQARNMTEPQKLHVTMAERGKGRWAKSRERQRGSAVSETRDDRCRNNSLREK